MKIKTIEPKQLKIKGKQYARPFVFKSYLSMLELNIQSDMVLMSKQIYAAFKIPNDLIQHPGDIINKRMDVNSEYGKSKLLDFLKNIT